MKERKIIKEKNQGITLIALIITIIILLILSSVSIGVIIKGDFFNKAQDTVGKANSGTENKKNQEENVKNVWDALPGKIIKSGTSEKSTIEIMVTTSNVTRTSFRVHAKGTNKNGDILTFVLKVGETIYTEQTGEEVYWDVTGLTPNTKYQFEVIARDARTENSVMGEETTLSNQKPELTIGASNVAATTATITATGTDGDGDTLMYVLKINGTQYGEIKTGTSGTEVSWDVTNLSETTTYTYTVEVNDSYDTITKSATFTTGTSNTAPVFVTNELQTRGTNSLAITAKATDAEGDNLTYELYIVGKSGVQATATAAQNTSVTLTATGLTQYTTYTWYVKAKDATLSTDSDQQSARTYCSGTGLTCTATLCSENRKYVDILCGKTCTVTSWKANSPWDYINCPGCGARLPYSATCSAYRYSHDDHSMLIWHCKDNGWMRNDGSTIAEFNNGTCAVITGQKEDYSSTCYLHNLSGQHYECTTHNYVGTSSTHTYCSHGYTSQHD